MKVQEQKLVSAILKGDQAALRLFNQRYRPKLLRFILSKVARFQDAEEIVQDTLVSALYSLPTFLGKSSLDTWLYSIARHEVADFYRKKKIKEILFSRFPALQRLASQALGPQMALEEKELEEKVWHCFKRLSEGYQRILRLKYAKGLSLAEIALRVGERQTAKAVEAGLRRARHQFARLWNEQKTFFTLDPRNLSFFEEWLGTIGTSLSDLKNSSS